MSHPAVWDGSCFYENERRDLLDWTEGEEPKVKPRGFILTFGDDQTLLAINIGHADVAVPLPVGRYQTATGNIVESTGAYCLSPTSATCFRSTTNTEA
jgi:hypothetical protein